MNAIDGEEWTMAMHALDFERAWQVSDRVLKDALVHGGPKHQGPRHLQQIWRGEPLQGARVLVRCYHGLGDTIQFIRFAAPLRRIAREVIVWCQPKLIDLVKRARGIDRILPLHDGVVAAEFDLDIEIMELPHALRITTRELGKDVPYLRISRSTCEPSDDLRVGVVWQAGEWDNERSLPWAALEPLAISGVRLCPLQPDASSGGPSTRPLVPIHALAAQMIELDLIISVDTMAAHLAGALGLPVWTMLPVNCNWRWGRTGAFTPWYPTMRLFRQGAAGDWSGPVRQASKALRRLQTRTVRERT